MKEGGFPFLIKLQKQKEKCHLIFKKKLLSNANKKDTQKQALEFLHTQQVEETSSNQQHCVFLAPKDITI